MEQEAADRIYAALEHRAEGFATFDLARMMPNGKPLGTKEFTEHLIERI